MMNYHQESAGSTSLLIISRQISSNFKRAQGLSRNLHLGEAEGQLRKGAAHISRAIVIFIFVA